MESKQLALVGRPSTLELLAISSGATPARTVLEAVEQAVRLLAGAYGALFQPPANVTLAWSIVLRDTSPPEIADALDEHVRDTSTRGGRARNEYPPTAPELLTRILEARARRARREKQQREYDDACVRWAEDPERARREAASCRNADGSRMDSVEIEARIDHGSKVLERRRNQADSVRPHASGASVQRPRFAPKSALPSVK